MLPVSSATTGCSCHKQIPIYGGLKSFSSYLKAFDCNYVNKSVRRFSYSSKTRRVTCFYSNYVGKGEQCSSIDMINQSLHQTGCGGYESGLLRPNLIFVDGPIESTVDDQLTDFISEVNPLSDQKTNVSDIIAQMNGSISDTINGGENVLNKSLDTFNSSLSAALSNANEAVDDVISDITSFLSKTGESAGNKLSGISSLLKEGPGTAGSVLVDLLRRSVGAVEDVVALGAKSFGNAYGYSKEFLPQEIQDALSSSEKVLSPIGTAFQQVYIAFEGFEESVGLDPNEPLIPVVLFVGVSAVLWGSYRVLKYSGYAGDLSAQSTMELLRGNEGAVLIDIRPENLRDRDGVPDLRRSARYRYASVTLPEVDGSVKMLLKGGRDVEDALLAAVIRDLKIVKACTSTNPSKIQDSTSKFLGLAVQVGGVLSTVLAEPALAVTGVNDEEDLVWNLIQLGISAFLYFIVAPPIIMNWLRLRWYRRNLLEMYFQFMFVFIFYPGVLVWAPFLNFRKFPRDPSMKYPWSIPENPSQIKGGFSKYPWAKPEDYEENYE